MSRRYPVASYVGLRQLLRSLDLVLGYMLLRTTNSPPSSRGIPAGIPGVLKLAGRGVNSSSRRYTSQQLAKKQAFPTQPLAIPSFEVSGGGEPGGVARWGSHEINLHVRSCAKLQEEGGLINLISLLIVATRLCIIIAGPVDMIYDAWAQNKNKARMTRCTRSRRATEGDRLFETRTQPHRAWVTSTPISLAYGGLQLSSIRGVIRHIGKTQPHRSGPHNSIQESLVAIQFQGFQSCDMAMSPI